MTNPNDFIRKSVLAIEPYTMQERQYRIKLNQNESPYDIPAALKSEILDRFSGMNWNRYPTFTTDELRGKIAAAEGISPDMVLVGNGSNELLQNICSILLGPEQEFLTIQPTFSLYAQLGQIFGARARVLELNVDFTFPVDAILDTLENHRIPLQIFCSPNNPTGSTLTLTELSQILDAADGIVVVDEAYHDFSGISAVGLIEKYPNLVVTRTFSKAFGLAGLRLGYCMAQPELTSQIYKAKLPYNLNLFSELAATVLLEHSELVQERVQEMLSQRDWLMRELSALPGTTIFPSRANFFLIQTPLTPDDLFEQVLARGLLLRNVS
ncbi:histidinol-phosphate transaminase, partial [bacterium]|nr:histidinol-phosphate transaminase [bacterium]